MASLTPHPHESPLRGARSAILRAAAVRTLESPGPAQLFGKRCQRQPRGVEPLLLLLLFFDFFPLRSYG